MTRRILITGASGQIGSNLIDRFENNEEVFTIASDLKLPTYSNADLNLEINVLNQERLATVVKEYQINEIYHLAALLSGTGEKRPQLAWDVNMNGLLNVLHVAKEVNAKVFWPSSVAVFGDNSPKENTPQHTITEPSTMYGLTKVSGELLSKYYFEHFNVDVRSVRFPGLISWKGEPGGGTTDYAVDIYHHAVAGKDYDCFLNQDSYLPMLYMEDAIDGILQVMAAPSEQIKVRTSYNMSGMSFSPKEITSAIQQHYPDFNIYYNPDFRQAIADSWPSSMDDSKARADWGWQPKFDLGKMTEEMIFQLKMTLEKDLV